ncbi:TonB-dependent receptor [Microbulbifer sp. SH-1]|nr:TonB-dependent receptor [Microbulbifer sp. SH-1]
MEGLPIPTFRRSMNDRRTRAWRFNLLCEIAVCCTLLAPVPLQAAVTDFSIPAGPLSDALAHFSRITGQTVLYDPRLVSGLEAPPVSGEFSREDAIAHLLQNAALVAERQGASWLIVSRRDSPPEPATGNAPSTAAGVEEVLVKGIPAAYQQSSLQKKYHSNRHQDFLQTADIQRLPAANIAEAITRSAGISVVRDRGEALFISMRGLPTQFNQVTLNGNALASSENVRTSEQYGRRFHYNLLPAELVSAVALSKSASAADTAGAIGGQIDLQTHRPLDMGASGVSTRVAGSASQLAGETSPRISAVGNWVNSDSSLGLSLITAYSQRSLRQDRVLNFRWLESEDGTLSPGGIRPTLEREESQRLGISTALQWQSGNGIALDVDLFGVKRHSDYQEFSYSADYDIDQLVPGSLQWRGDALIGGDTQTGSVQIGRESAGLTDSLYHGSVSLSRETDEWKVTGALAISRARSYNSDPIRRTRLRRDGDVAFQFWYPKSGEGALPTVTYHNVSLNDPEDFPGRRLEWRYINAQDGKNTLKLAASRTLDDGPLERVEFGAEWQFFSRDYQRRDRMISDGIEGAFFPDEYFLALPVDDFLHSVQAHLPAQWLVPDEERFWQLADPGYLTDTAQSSADRMNSYNVAENNRALFVRSDMRLERWRGELGLRYLQGSRHARGHWPDESMQVLPLTVTASEDRLLPSLNLSFAPARDQLLRFSAARVVNRPDLQDLAPRLTLNSGDTLTAVGGNPELKMVVGNQFDFAWEWYLPADGLFSISVFHTTLDGFIQTDTRDIDIGGQTYELTSRSNGGSARINGLEMEYRERFSQLPSPWDGLGIRANISLTDSNARYRAGDQYVEDTLADVAPRTANAGIWFESAAVTVNVDYGWRDQILKQVGSFNQAAQNSEPFGNLDARISVALGRDISLFAEGSNLTGAAERESIAGGEFAGYSYYGRTFTLGVDARF